MMKLRDWNVVATTRNQSFRRACELLSLAGRLASTEFYNVVVLKVEDVEAFLSWLERQWTASDRFPGVVAHVRPARDTFHFGSPEEFEAKAIERAGAFARGLEGRSFFVRVHRRGFKGRLSSHDEERLIADAILERTSSGSPPCRVDFEKPDAVIAIDTVGNRAGLSLWSRDELDRYSFLGLIAQGPTRGEKS